MDKMAFAYHISRHGARSLDELGDLKEYGYDGRGFTVEKGELTPTGMRQRYMKGRQNRVRYQVQYQLLSEKYVPGEVFIQSSHLPRCIQSGYSELMGLYALENDESSSLMDTKVDVPFNVRDADTIAEKLGAQALPHGLTAIPVMNTEPTNFLNIRDEGCAMSDMKDMEFRMSVG